MLDFGIDGEVTAVRPGPVITLYEFKPGPGVKVSRIAALADDLSMALSAQSVRILAPLPGKSVVGIEIPSENRETVYMREFLQHPDFYAQPTHHSGRDGQGHRRSDVSSDLARMPHLLCAGQTGAGKSVFMNGLICSLLYRFTPDELRMILVDPKFIEFRAYQDIPHLLLPVVDDPMQASIALKWAVREMERRYRILAKIGARNLAAFNQKVDEMGSEVIRDLFWPKKTRTAKRARRRRPKPGPTGSKRLSRTRRARRESVSFLTSSSSSTSLADLMMIAKKEVEISIARIAQKARAAGIHLVIATQRPSTDVMTGLIKANLPSRVSFQLASFVDSKTILDRAGAERLLGQGDMLFIPPGVSQTLASSRRVCRRRGNRKNHRLPEIPGQACLSRRDPARCGRRGRRGRWKATRIRTRCSKRRWSSSSARATLRRAFCSATQSRLQPRCADDRNHGVARHRRPARRSSPPRSADPVTNVGADPFFYMVGRDFGLSKGRQVLVFSRYGIGKSCATAFETVFWA